MTFSIGDLLLFMESDLYVITEIKIEHAYFSGHHMKTGNHTSYQYTLLLINPKKKIKLRKRYMNGDALHKAINNINPQWKHFPVIE